MNYMFIVQQSSFLFPFCYLAEEESGSGDVLWGGEVCYVLLSL